MPCGVVSLRLPGVGLGVGPTRRISEMPKWFANQPGGSVEPCRRLPAELNDLYLRGRADLESLSRDEVYQFSNLALKAFWFFSAAHFQFRMGTLADSDWQEQRAAIRYWLRGPG